MIGVVENPHMKALIESYVPLLVSNAWSERRKASARRAIEQMCKRASQIGATGAHVSHDRAAHQHAMELAVELVAAIDPEKVSTDPDRLAAAKEMQALVVLLLSSLEQGRAAA